MVLATKWALAIALGSLCVLGSAGADILFGTDFENPVNSRPKSEANAVWMSNMSEQGEPRNHAGVDTLSRRVSEMSLSGNYAYRFGLSYFFDYGPFNGGLQKPRSALLWNDPRAELYAGREYWIAFAICFPEEYIFDHAENPDNVFQLVKNDPGTTGPLHKNMLAWGLYGDRMVMRWQHKNGAEDPEEATYDFKLQKGKWHRIVMHIKLATLETIAEGGEGLFEIYLNGKDEPVFCARGANTISQSHKIALNFYKYWWHCKGDDPRYEGELKDARGDYDFCMGNPQPTKDDGSANPFRYFYVDDFFVGDGNSSLEEVAPNWR